MPPRIEKADVLSFRLQVPLDALLQLPEQLGSIPMDLESIEEQAVRLSLGDSTLSFVRIGSTAELDAIQIRNDESGIFFQRILGPLMIRFHGSLHVRVHWNVRDRNSHGDHSEVEIREGRTSYPGLAPLGTSLLPAPPQAMERWRPEPDSVGPEEAEVERLLSEARKLFEQYQRAKAKNHSQTA